MLSKLLRLWVALLLILSLAACAGGEVEDEGDEDEGRAGQVEGGEDDEGEDEGDGGD